MNNANETRKNIVIDNFMEIAFYNQKFTRRQRLIFFKKYIEEVKDIISSIEPQINKNGFAWYLGDKMYKRDLREWRDELNNLTLYFDDITSKQTV